MKIPGILATVRPCVALLVLALVPAAGCHRPAPGHRFLLPAGYVGWIRIDFGVPGTPALAEENGYHLVQVPPSGVVQTSSAMRTSPKHDEIFTTSSQGRRAAPRFVAAFTSQPLDSVQAHDGRVSLFAFFGPEKAWELATKDLPPTQLPTPGWIR